MGTKTGAEQLGTGNRFIKHKAGTKRWWKRVSAKIMRRMGKQLKDNAPRKLPYKGWFD